MPIKQVIVIRTKYQHPDGSYFTPRKGKLIAQACHASTAWLKSYVSPIWEGIKNLPHMSSEEIEWLNGDSTKICLYVESEEELMDIFNKAKEEKLSVHLITDLGRTEFGGIPTNTCLAIGPNESDRIDKVTGGLKLL